MSTVWNSRGIGKNIDLPMPQEILNEEGVILMQGKNAFGDKVYCYLKITLGALRDLREKLISNAPFSPSDFGTVVAAGKGEPTEEVKAEINMSYRTLDSVAPKTAADAPAKPAEQKSWDDY